MDPDRDAATAESGLAGAVTARDLTLQAAAHVAHLTRIVCELQILLGLAPAAAVIPRQHRGLPGVGSSADGQPRSAPPDLTSRLTCREREVLAQLVQGMSNRRIARTLKITEPTVKNHLHAVFLKLDVTDRTQAIAKVLRAP